MNVEDPNAGLDPDEVSELEAIEDRQRFEREKPPALGHSVTMREALPPDVERVRRECGRLLDAIARLFLPRCRTTLIVRDPETAESDFSLSNDEPEALAAFVARRFTSPLPTTVRVEGEPAETTIHLDPPLLPPAP